MPYKDKRKLYAAQRRYRQRQRNHIKQAKEELKKAQPNITSLRKLLGVNLRETADSMAFGKPSKAAKHILENVKA